MKKIILLLFCAIFTNSIIAQVRVSEPEFAEQIALLTSDTTSVILERENGYLKTKAGASLYLVGIGKIKSRITIDGAKSISKVLGLKNTRLIIKAEDNKTDPKSFIDIFKFDVYKNKERRYQIAEAGTLSAAKSNNLSSIDYVAKKYGETSYLILLADLTPGEYGIILGDPNKENTKNNMKITYPEDLIIAEQLMKLRNGEV